MTALSRGTDSAIGDHRRPMTAGLSASCAHVEDVRLWLDQALYRCYRRIVRAATPDSQAGPDSGGPPINLASLGRVRVLRALADSPVLSRAELVQRTGLARATVGSVVDDLIAAGVVRKTTESAPAGARIGRPPQLLSLEPRAAYAAGLDIGHDHVRVILTDLV